MKIIVWGTLGVLLALWSGLAALSAQLLTWLLSALADGHLNEAAQRVGQWPVPQWLGIWVDPAMVSELQASFTAALQWLSAVMPSAGSLSGWIVPLVWGVWAVVSAAMLAAAITAHLLISRNRR